MIDQMSEKQNEIDSEEQKRIDEQRKQREKAGFLKRLSVHNKPAYFIFIGLIFSLIAGALLPSFGIWFAKMLFTLQTPLDPTKPENWLPPITIDFKQASKWGIILGSYAPIAFFAMYFNRISWAILAENMTKNIRGFLYSSMLRKDIGWFDHKENSPG